MNPDIAVPWVVHGASLFRCGRKRSKCMYWVLTDGAQFLVPTIKEQLFLYEGGISMTDSAPVSKKSITDTSFVFRSAFRIRIRLFCQWSRRRRTPWEWKMNIGRTGDLSNSALNFSDTKRHSYFSPHSPYAALPKRSPLPTTTSTIWHCWSCCCSHARKSKCYSIGSIRHIDSKNVPKFIPPFIAIWSEWGGDKKQAALRQFVAIIWRKRVS